MTNKQAWPPSDYPVGTDPRPFHPTLRDRTWHALREHMDAKKGTLREIAAGAGVEHGWLRIFAGQGNIPDPAVSRIESLYFYLTGVKL